MKFLWSKLALGELYTDDANDADDTDDNTTQWTEHDCIGSLPNEPKIERIEWVYASFKLSDFICDCNSEITFSFMFNAKISMVPI